MMNASGFVFIPTFCDITGGEQLVLCGVHWTVTRWPVGKGADWSSVLYRRGTHALEVCDLRGSLEGCAVGLHEVPTQKWPRQSCDEKKMLV